MSSLSNNILKNLANEGTESLGKFYSFYRGYVLDNEDPESLGRLKVLVPGIIEDDIDYWAWPVNMMGGKNYGVNSIPPTGSTIYVVFELGDPSQPLWFHGWRSEGEVSPEDGKPGTHRYTSPGGAAVKIDDDTFEVIITSHTGTKVHLNQKGASIELASSNEKIFLGSKDRADEPAVLGDTIEKLLSTIIENQMKINSKISDLSDDFVSTLRDIGGASLGPVMGATMVAKATTLAIEMVKFKADIAGYNKSIEAQYKQFESFKSETVKLNK